MLSEVGLLFNERGPEFFVVILRCSFDSDAIELTPIRLLARYNFHLMLLKFALLPSKLLILVEKLIISFHMLIDFLERNRPPFLHKLFHLFEFDFLLVHEPLFILFLHRFVQWLLLIGQKL